jgi:hypothetical protein
MLGRVADSAPERMMPVSGQRIPNERGLRLAICIAADKIETERV